MAFFVNQGYSFSLPDSIEPEGCIILASANTKHAIVRRKIKKNQTYMQNRLFDPQLYLSGLDPIIARKPCINLSSYPWFNCSGVEEYDSTEITQAGWKARTSENIRTIWKRKTPEDLAKIEDCVKQCIDFQVSLNCKAIIAPGPLTIDPRSNYGFELTWLDSCLNYCKQNNINLPVFATIALQDVCTRFIEPEDNPLLSIILDSISAREISGVYIILEQGSEAADTRNCTDTRSLKSILYLTHIFSQIAHIKVGVNFIGQFGLVCEAVGASFWASGWYKSLYRLRLADHVAAGRAYPNYWSFPAATEINLDEDMDIISKESVFPKIIDLTSASESLLKALQSGKSVSDVPTWRYSMSNISSSKEHYLLSSIKVDNQINALSGKKQLTFVKEWLNLAGDLSGDLEILLGESAKTKLSHVQPWNQSLINYLKIFPLS